MIMLRTFFLLVAITTLTLSCQDPAEEVKEAAIDTEGYWGCDMYIKGLVQDKKLTVQLICPIAWNNLVFKIKGRQLIRIGLLNNADTLQLRTNPDSLVHLDGFGSFILRYNRNAARLEAISIDKNTGSCSAVNTFRRLSPQEGKGVFELLQTYSISPTGPLGF